MPYRTHLDSANGKKDSHSITNVLYMYHTSKSFSSETNCQIVHVSISEALQKKKQLSTYLSSLPCTQIVRLEYQLPSKAPKNQICHFYPGTFSDTEFCISKVYLHNKSKIKS